MLSLHHYRRWLCRGLIATLLLVQWMVAAYACPMQVVGVPAANAATAASPGPMPGRIGEMAGMDAEQPQLCKAHCRVGQQSVNRHAGLGDAAKVPARRQR